MPKVSIIVPVYNVEQYLKRCLDSLTRQTFKDMEIIVIDDGSGDFTAELVRSYASKDNRIKPIIKNRNDGQGFCRNIGIRAAIGKYIAFVDSDDWLEPGAIEKLYNKAEEFKAEVINFNSRVIKPNKTTESDIISRMGSFVNKNLQPQYDSSNEVYYSYNWHDIKPEERLHHSTTCWEFFYLRDFLVRNNVRFSESRVGEDNLFAIMTVVLAKKIYAISDVLYNYCHRASSVETNKSDYVFTVDTLINDIQNFVNYVKGRPDLSYDAIDKDFEDYKFVVFSHRFRQVPENRQKEYYALCKKNLSKEHYRSLCYKRLIKKIFSIENVWIEGQKYKLTHFFGIKFLSSDTKYAFFI